MLKMKAERTIETPDKYLPFATVFRSGKITPSPTPL
jgi:hypothetical protein